MEVTCPSGLKGEIQKPKVRVMNEMRKIANQDRVKSFSYLLSQTWAKTLDKGPYRWDGEVVPWEDVLSGDRFYILLKIREALFGPKYEFKVRCANCNLNYSWIVELTDLEVKALGKESQEALLRDEKTIHRELAFGHTMAFRLSTGRVERALMREEEPILKYVMPRLVSFDDLKEPEKIREALLDLDHDVLDEMSGVMQEADCGVETGIECVCPGCGTFQALDLPFGRAFFFPRSAV